MKRYSDTKGDWSVKNNIVVRLVEVEKNYGDNRIVKKISMDIPEGEFLTLLGPSGCGKTTTLRMIAGFETVTAGKILLHGEDVREKKPNERDVNTVFQNYALFPHMNIKDNISFGLVEKKMPKSEIKKRVSEMLKLVRLEGMEHRMPSQLSGGQKQRVAIARALVNHPSVLLLDEPLGALDLKLRKQMQSELKHLQQQLGITFIYVTHDQEEALAMSDRIAVMNDGVIEQIGTPREVYDTPRTKFVADFIGESNIIEGYSQSSEDGLMRIIFESGKAIVHDKGIDVDEMLYICIRPENLRVTREPVKGFSIKGRVKEHIFTGSSTKTIIELLNGQELKAARTPEAELFEIGERVNISWAPDRAVVLHTTEDKLYDEIENNSATAMFKSFMKEDKDNEI